MNKILHQLLLPKNESKVLWRVFILSETDQSETSLMKLAYAKNSEEIFLRIFK